LLRQRRAPELASLVEDPQIGPPLDREGKVAIVVSHQPTLLSYTGVYAQFFLADFIAQRLARGRDVRVIYLSLDGDDSRDRRIRTAHLPLPVSPTGSLPISLPVPHNRIAVSQFGIPAPTDGLIEHWLEQVAGGLARCADLVPSKQSELLRSIHLIRTRLENLVPQSSVSFSDWATSVLHGFLKPFLRSSFEVRTMSGLVREHREVFGRLLRSWPDVRRSARVAVEALEQGDIGPISAGILGEDPAWMVCWKCKSRTSVSAGLALRLLDGTSFDCPSCNEPQGELGSDACVIPKVLLEDLFMQEALNPALVLTYAGSAEHVVVGEWTRSMTLARPSSLYTWHPRQILGSAIEAASLSLARESQRYPGALSSLSRIAGGRDSLLHALSHPASSDLALRWTHHLARKPLTEPVVAPGADSHDILELVGCGEW
jgi:hypothetical protein